MVLKALPVLFRAKIDEYLAYRINFVMWRVRNVVTLLMVYYLWSAVYETTRNVQGYTEAMLLSYIFIASIINAVVMSSKTDQIAGDILNGNIMTQLLKPLDIFVFVGTREAADKTLNVVFSILEVGIFIAIFRPELFIPDTLAPLLLFSVFVVFALCLSFFISLSLSLMAFWTTEIWAPRFVFFVLVSLVAGTLFPLDILPQGLVDVLLLTPFPYLVYVPVKLLIFGLDLPLGELGLYTGVSLGWLAGMALITRYLWNRGLREFSFFGK